MVSFLFSLLYYSLSANLIHFFIYLALDLQFRFRSGSLGSYIGLGFFFSDLVSVPKFDLILYIN